MELQPPLKYPHILAPTHKIFTRGTQTDTQISPHTRLPKISSPLKLKRPPKYLHILASGANAATKYSRILAPRLQAAGRQHWPDHHPWSDRRRRQGRRRGRRRRERAGRGDARGTARGGTSDANLVPLTPLSGRPLPRPPPWTVWRPRPRLRTPERRLRRAEARGGLRSPPPPAL